MAISGFVACIVGCILCSIVSAIAKLGDSQIKKDNNNVRLTLAIIVSVIECIICLITLYFMLRSPPVQYVFGPQQPGYQYYQSTAPSPTQMTFTNPNTGANMSNLPNMIPRQM